MPYPAALYSATRRRLRRFVVTGRFLSLLVLLLSVTVLIARALTSAFFLASDFAAT